MGILALLIAARTIQLAYQGCRIGSFRWHTRNWRMEQLCAISCLFLFSMAASYGVLQQAWGWLYLIAAIKVGTWWFRRIIGRRA